jgi:hypothetical protein
MSRLEGTAKPYLLSMIRGHARTYHEAGQKILATSAVKTAPRAVPRLVPSAHRLCAA